MAEDSSTLEIAGASAVFPRSLYVNGQKTMGFVLGDFCIHPEYRTLGPAVQLQRACLEQMSSEIRRFGYDLPGAGMLAVHRRLGTTPQSHLVRMAKPLRVNRKVAERVRNEGLANGLSSIGNQVLKWRDAVRSHSKKYEIAWNEGPFGEEFSKLAAEVANNPGITTSRTADYLNWRYMAHPIRRFEVLTAREAGVLGGYLVLTRDADDACIVDLFGKESLELLSSLVGHAVEFLRGLNVMTVNAHVLATHPWMRLFARLGFEARDSCPVVFYASDPAVACGGTSPATTWFLMDGDRES